VARAGIGAGVNRIENKAKHGVGDDGAFVLELNIYLRAIRTRVRSAVIYSRSHPTPRASMAKAPPPQNAPAEPS